MCYSCVQLQQWKSTYREDYREVKRRKSGAWRTLPHLPIIHQPEVNFWTYWPILIKFDRGLRDKFCKNQELQRERNQKQHFQCRKDQNARTQQPSLGGCPLAKLSCAHSAQPWLKKKKQCLLPIVCSIVREWGSKFGRIFLMETEEIEVSHDSKTGEFETVALGWWVSWCGIKICRKLDFISPAAGAKHVLNYCCCYPALQTSQENAEVSVRNWEASSCGYKSWLFRRGSALPKTSIFCIFFLLSHGACISEIGLQVIKCYFPGPSKRFLVRSESIQLFLAGWKNSCKLFLLFILYCFCHRVTMSLGLYVCHTNKWKFAWKPAGWVKEN